ncbi:thioredoxin [Candidatus Shapirobacteria bacterium CG09_land_8_20_14_0_10_49_15]|uniref:Thioredoxin n=2 Tax=Candidatus Shapironibacteriota TaxID=1752721 RepID=A0A2M8L7R9_9BACT|nr:MAG: thioredoxin [Candidatus Shapirobacteria bacterium CG09_land_8_20_14_0_10_49_15]PJE70285.1 MAG: thioredoxin [Candidatus Shapirobacteria bacterium CG10_big_fil_rev_8_21_14_0_10_48_15]
MILTEQNFQTEVLKSDKPVLVDFFAVWCGPCQLLAPILDQLAKDYEGKIKVGKLDVEPNQALAQKYGVLGVPTVILFKNGQEVKRMVGVQDKSGLIEELGLDSV